MDIKKIAALLFSIGGVVPATALPFGPPQPIEDPFLPLGAAGNVLASSLSPISLNGVRGVISISAELDRLSFLDPAGAASQVIDPDLRGGSAMVVIDVENDGDSDIVAASRWRRELYLYPNEGDGVFGPRVTLATNIDTATRLIAADLDGDSRKDLVGITDHDRRLFRMKCHATGLGSLEVMFRTSVPLQALAAGDLDHDGKNELALGHGSQIIILKTQPNGDLTVSETLDFDASQLEFGDLNGDGMQDLLACHSGSGAWFCFAGKSNGSLERPQALPVKARALEALDLDGDGDPDLVEATQPEGNLRWLENLGAFSFSGPRFLSELKASIMIAWDSDGDGHADIFSSDPRQAKVVRFPSLAGKPYERWATDHGMSQSDPEDDANGDGRANMIHYALGLDPMESSTIDFIKQEAGTLLFEFPWRDTSSPTGLTYRVETSADLIEWREASAAALEILPSVSGWQRVRLHLEEPELPRRFARLRVTYENP